MNLNLKAQPQKTYDAIVVGSGISEGWASKDFAKVGVLITDGSFISSSSCVNPSLIYNAMTARTFAFAVEEMKK